MPCRGLRAGRAPQLARRPDGRVLRARARHPRGVPADPPRVRAATDALEPGIPTDPPQGLLAEAAARAADAGRLHPRDAVPDGDRVAAAPVALATAIAVKAPVPITL